MRKADRLSRRSTDPRRSFHLLENLEDRVLLSTTLAPPGKQPTAASDMGAVANYGALIYQAPKAADGPTPAVAIPGLTPTQVRHAYGMDHVSFGAVQGDGTGQTIAIVDAYDYPSAASDLHVFSTTFGMSDPPSFVRMSQTGSTTSFPSTDSTGGWEVEEALDIEWAHAMAPGANIVLVEANNNSYANLWTAVRKARSLTGVSVVSMSFGGNEYSSQTSDDSNFLTPSGHNGVTFLASTGDDGSPGGYPANSPNVVAVGGTRLTLTSSGDYSGETGWSGSGGGVSTVESVPSYQLGIAGSLTPALTKRGTPDVSMDADPRSGVAVYDTFKQTTTWFAVGGTSLSAPLWAGVIAVVNQGRAIHGLATLNGKTQTLPGLYALPAADFHDITDGTNGYDAKAGYDLVTGRGTPILDKLVYDLAGIAANTPLTVAGTASSDVIYVKLSGSTLNEWVNSATPGQGTPTHQDSVLSTSPLTITGSGGADLIVLDMTGGTLAAFPVTVSNPTGSADLVLIGSTLADSVAINGTTKTITFNSKPITFDNATSITYWDSGGGDTIVTAGPVPVTLNAQDSDDITVNGGTATINFVAPGATPTFAGPASTPAIRITSGTTTRTAAAPPTRSARPTPTVA